jgi:hypothetical protein
MSELLRGHENKEGNEVGNAEAAQERSREIAAEHERNAAEAERKHQENSIEKIQERIEQSARDKEDIKINQQESDDSKAHVPMGKQLRDHASNLSLIKTRKKLSKPDRAFSKVIHQPIVDAVSNAAEGTVARPSGLLVGGLFSLISSLIVLYVCRHYGYEYNFLIGMAAFVGGFCMGLLLEGSRKLVTR